MLHLSFAKQLLAALLAVILAVPGAAAAQQADASSSTQKAQTAQGTQQNSPAPYTPTAPPTSQAAQQDVEQASAEPQQTGTANPVGTAAAPTEKPVGVTGSEPAGAAIAPAKQRRIRRIFISVGAIVGAGIAVGTVAALSRSSPSRPH